MDLNSVTRRHPVAFLKAVKRKVMEVLQRGRRTPPPRGPHFIDVRELITRSSLEELNRKAEEYFSTLPNWDHHLAKPFSTIGEAPQLLINFGAVLQGMKLSPGVRVLDFGAGSGWTSRWLTQLGCQVVLLDVSSTALEIARELYRRQPVIGDRPEPEFLGYDGRRIGLPDQSVDRILSFDAFHHSTEPVATIRELGRILKPGGIAAFVEPGPHHSTTEQSQFEMRNFGVVENDVDIRGIWTAARHAGFERIRMAAFHNVPFHVSLGEYEELLDGGATYLRWAEATRGFLHDVRLFFLQKAGEEELDSRRTEGLAATIDAAIVSGRASPGEAVEIRATVTNSGRSRWLPSGTIPGGVSLGCHVFDAAGRKTAWDFHWQPLGDPPREIAPGDSITVHVPLPPLPHDAAELELDCVADRVCWFAEVGSKTVRIGVA